MLSSCPKEKKKVGAGTWKGEKGFGSQVSDRRDKTCTRTPGGFLTHVATCIFTHGLNFTLNITSRLKIVLHPFF